jgi:hypothetical protein
MQITELKKGQMLHVQGAAVETIDIISKGEIKVFNDYSEVSLKGGQIAGLTEKPGSTYAFSYRCEADGTVVCSYPVASLEEIAGIIRSNPKISPLLSSNIVKTAISSITACKEQLRKINDEITELKQDYEDYPGLCATTGIQQKNYPEMNDLQTYTGEELIHYWEIAGLESLADNDAKLRQSFFSISTEINAAFIMTIIELLSRTGQKAQDILKFREEFLDKTRDFRNEINVIKAKAHKISSGDDNFEEVPDFKNVLSTILAYGKVDGDIAEKFRNAVSEYKTNTTHDAYDDSYRKIKGIISSNFYKIYSAVFLETLKDDVIPDAVMMFLTFGYVDEDLVSEEQTAALYRIMKSYAFDPDGRVLTIYEWLLKIYRGEIVPSRNEFNLDYPGYLREQKTQGEITEDEMNRLMNDPVNKVLFEINNLMTLGNRMTFGQASSFIPIFDEDNITKPLPDAFMSYTRINEALDNIRQDDYTLFYRDVMFSDPSIGLNTFVYPKEILPYVILFPNCGSRASMWQEIEGKQRSTPARFCISIFHSADLSDSMARVCGDYRWEMCKTIQGVHWNDVTDPSLTADYCDYLQFFKKNRVLTQEQKDKVYQELKKYGNRYNTVFIANYMSYLKFERAGSLRLNKVARQILFTYCPFSEELRTRLEASPQYAELLRAFEIKNAGAKHTLDNIIVKIEKLGKEIPEEVRAMQNFLEL